MTKFAAAAFTGSAAIMSEGVHSVVDTGNQVLLLYGMRQAAKPLTPDHPFGYGLRLYFRAFVVAILIFGLGAGLSIVNCIDKIRTPHAIEDAWLNYSVLGLGMVFEGGVWWVAFRAFREEMGERGDVPFNGRHLYDARWRIACGYRAAFFRRAGMTFPLTPQHRNQP